MPVFQTITRFTKRGKVVQVEYHSPGSPVAAISFIFNRRHNTWQLLLHPTFHTL